MSMIQKKPQKEWLQVRSMKVDPASWDKASIILNRKYNMSMAEFLRTQIDHFLAEEAGNDIHENQGTLDV